MIKTILCLLVPLVAASTTIRLDALLIDTASSAPLLLPPVQRIVLDNSSAVGVLVSRTRVWTIRGTLMLGDRCGADERTLVVRLAQRLKLSHSSKLIKKPKILCFQFLFFLPLVCWISVCTQAQTIGWAAIGDTRAHGALDDRAVQRRPRAAACALPARLASACSRIIFTAPRWPARRSCARHCACRRFDSCRSAQIFLLAFGSRRPTRCPRLPCRVCRITYVQRRRVPRRLSANRDRCECQ